MCFFLPSLSRLPVRREVLRREPNGSHQRTLSQLQLPERSAALSPASLPFPTRHLPATGRLRSRREEERMLPQIALS